MNVGVDLKRLCLASAAGGILLGAALDRALPPPVHTTYSSSPAFAGCDADGEKGCVCDRPFSPAGRQQNPAVRASELLASYSASLCKLADAVEAFRKAPVGDRDELRRAARPMFDPIRGVNQAARALVLARVPLTLDVLTQAGPASLDNERLACLLKSADEFQVEDYRNNLNTLLINIVVAWQGNGDQNTYANVRRQQASDWPRLALVLRRGCEQYRQRNQADPAW